MDPLSPDTLASASDVQLVLALTFDRERYTTDMCETLGAELERRGLSLDDVRSRAVLEDESTCTVDEALDALASPIDEWSLRVVRNALGDAIGVQRTVRGVVVHLATPERYVGFRVADRLDDVRTEIEPWLRLDARLDDASSGMEGWETLSTSTSLDHARGLARELAEADVPFVVHGSDLAPVYRPFAATHMVQVLIPERSWSDAEPITARRAARAGELHETADACAERGDTAGELAAYDEILSLTPDDAMLLFNRGVALREVGRPDEAAHSFMDAIPHLFADETLARHVPDVRDTLRELLAESANPSALRHSLANIAVSLGDPDEAVGLYREVLAADAADAAAHLGLAQLYYEDGDHDEDAKRHFARYLELDPESPNRDSIERTLNELAE